MDTSAPDAEPDAPAAGDRATFRLAVFGALLVVVLFAGYGIGRLTYGVTSAPAAPDFQVAGAIHTAAWTVLVS